MPTTTLTVRFALTAYVAMAALGVTIADSTNAQDAAGATTIQSMRWQRRIVLFSAVDTVDSAFDAQRKLLSSWAGASERDVSVVQIAGDHVVGSTDIATALRHEYGLPMDHFTIILIGKDGHVALRSATPVSADDLTSTIDAMPMRRAGQR